MHFCCVYSRSAIAEIFVDIALPLFQHECANLHSHQLCSRSLPICHPVFSLSLPFSPLLYLVSSFLFFLSLPPQAQSLSLSFGHVSSSTCCFAADILSSQGSLPRSNYAYYKPLQKHAPLLCSICHSCCWTVGSINDIWFT